MGASGPAASEAPAPFVIAAAAARSVREFQSPKFEVSDNEDEGGATTPKTDLEHWPSEKQAVRKSRAANGFPKAKVAKEESGEKAPDVEGPKEQFKKRRFKSRADEEARKDTGGEDVEKPEEKVRS